MIHEAWQSFLDRTPRATAANHDAVASGTGSGGIAWLPELRVASFEGPDVLRFLQGYLTCDTAGLDATRFQPAAICSLKGRVVVNGWTLAPHPEQVLFVIHASLFEVLGSLLKIYLRFSKTRLVDLGAERLVFGGLDLVAAADGAPIDARHRFILCADINSAERLWHTHAPLGYDAWQARLIADRMALVSAATSDAFLPQMLDLPAQGAIDFGKGCYLGQEVVARAQHRGQVKRHLARLAWQGGTIPIAGAELADAGGRNRGVVIQSAGRSDAGTCLAVVQEETLFPLHLESTEFTLDV